MKILLLDNYDSFTYNLKALIEYSVPDAVITVRRNKDPFVLEETFDVLVVSPGPMSWHETGILFELFEKRVIPEKIPVLGICLGMQFIAGYFGSDVGRIRNPAHGSKTMIRHEGGKLFEDIPVVFEAARYNSLGLYEVNESCLEVIAREDRSGAVMALIHRSLPMAGFQFHPESFLTGCGDLLIKNFMAWYVKNRI
jgi:anthranilate synthase/aminodeoxychorismate synthase-like glutamine amidotransferase